MKFNISVPDGWDLLTVSDLINRGIIEKPIDGNHGGIHPKSSDYVTTGVPFVMASDLKNGAVDFSSCKYISDAQAKTLRKGFSKTGDVLLSHKATIGRTAIVQENDFSSIVLTPQVTYYRIIDKSVLDANYLKSYFDSKFFQDTLGQWAGAGSTRAYLGITDQLKLPIIVPPAKAREKIGQMARMLNEKATNLRESNKTLEAIAQAIFTSWFVDFEPVKAKAAVLAAGGSPSEAEAAAIRTLAPALQAVAVGAAPAQQSTAAATTPNKTIDLRTLAAAFPSELVESELGLIPKGWEPKPLSSLAEFLNGVAGQKYPANDDEDSLPIVKILEMNNGITAKTGRGSPRVPSKYVINDGDLIFSWSGTLKTMIWAKGRAILNQHLFKVTPEQHPLWFVHQWINYHLKRFQDIAKDKAVTMGHIKRSHLDEALCSLPDDASVIDIANLLLQPISSNILTATIQTASLEQLRDAMLPELLKGNAGALP